jgi:branched-chain amino acid transport system permease protein
VQSRPGQIRNNTIWLVSGLLAVLLICLPLISNSYVTLTMTGIYVQIIGVLGLNLLTGNTGLISLGYSAFLAVGAYANAILQVDAGMSALLSIPAAGLVAAALGFCIGIPSLRLRGLYLAITTLALAIIVNVIIVEGGDLTRGSAGINVPPLSVFGVNLAGLVSFNYVCLGMFVAFLVITLNIERTHVGRAFMAIRESEVAAAASGIFVTKYKLIAFVISSFYIGVAGALFAHFVGYLNVDSFNPTIGIEALAMIIAGGLGSAFGSILGVLALDGLAEALRAVIGNSGGILAAVFPAANSLELRGLIFGLAIILFLRFQPNGVVGIFRAALDAWLRRKQPSPPRHESYQDDSTKRQIGASITRL